MAIGRKNWLFAGNAAAENHALQWSLIASCERRSVDPRRYLTSVLAKIGQTPAEQLGQFLPDVWKAEDAAEPIPAEWTPKTAGTWALRFAERKRFSLSFRW